MSTSAEITLTRSSDSPAETHGIALRIGEACRGGEVIALDGVLGAGKTTFTKGLAEGLGIDPREVTSPTFLLMHEIHGRLTLCHLDAYRVGDAEELAEIGARDAFRGDSVVVLEWSERVPELLPEDRLEVRLSYREEDTRNLSFRATGPNHGRLVSVALEGDSA